MARNGALEKALVAEDLAQIVGYAFNRRELLEEALMHPSLMEVHQVLFRP